MSAADREELLRISVGSVNDWLRVKNNYNTHLLDALRDVLDTPDLHPERDAILAHFNHFVESTFSMTQANLRVNGHNFDSIDAAGQDMEAFDEALDRRIWSLADTRLQWHKRMAKTRRDIPKEIQSRLSDLLNKGQAQDLDISQANDILSDDDGEILDDPAPIPIDVIEDFHLTSATTEELDQNVPSQQKRVRRVEKATTELKYLKC